MAPTPNIEKKSEWERKLLEAGLTVAMLVSMLVIRDSKFVTNQVVR